MAVAERGGEGGGGQDRLIHRAAHGGDAARLVDGRPDDREIEAFAAADVAEEHLADMQAEIHLRGRQASAARRSLSAAMLWRGGRRGVDGARQARLRSSARKMASTPSPISFSTSPPWLWTAEIDRLGIVVEERDDLSGGAVSVILV